ncbi:alpha/beta hydrolase [Inquilinus sp. CAU 1745]|uniref:alpha/beta hydrolase n=1 Tax=Inquilinus sp. CAU 1745 TaxID=3140369 RepID=UPI00325B1E85
MMKAAHHSLAAPDGTSLAYASLPASGSTLPGLVFLGGFRSDMTGVKATALEAFCAARGQPFLRFDYRGHGASGGRFEEATVGDWVSDALAMIDGATSGPLILVGSSMGAWIAVLAAIARPKRIAGLVGIASAPDFTEDLIHDRLTAGQKAELARAGVLRRPSVYDTEPYPITSRLIEDGRERLVLRAPIPLAIPLRLVHGLADPDVPWVQSRRLLEAWECADARLTLVKDGDHRLSREQDLSLMMDAAAEISALVTPSAAAPAG